VDNPGVLMTSIVIPTHARPGYLEVTLRSLAPQAAEAGAELVVVGDEDDPRTAEVAERHGAGLVVLSERGANAKRNAGVATARGELLVFTDDDIEAPAGWLRAMLKGVQAAPDHGVFGGPIRARLEGRGIRGCGRESAPITTLDLGTEDRDVPFVWSANMAIRRQALESVGEFDETITVRGDEEDWLRRYVAQGGRVRYVADAAVVHRRSAADATVGKLARAAYGQGRAARRYDVRKGSAPPLGRELRTLAGCAWHTVRRRCANGIVLGAHTAGRLRQALADLHS
jgi:GT2 family glycosyltransferase